MHLISKRPVVMGMGVGLALVGAVVGTGWMRTQGTLKVAVAGQQAVLVAGPLKVAFSQDVAAGFSATIEPKVAGTWQTERTVFGVSAVAFTPTKRFEAGRTYSLHIKGMKRAVTNQALGEVQQGFATQLPSGVAKTSPAADAVDVAAKPRLTVVLREANQGVRQLKPTLTPAIPLKYISSDDKTFVWEPQTPLKQGEKYTFTLEDTRVADPAKRNLFNNVFTVVAQPVIASARTGGYFTPGQTVDIGFGQPMEPSATAFKFDLAGKGSWVDDRTYRYVPTDGALKPGKTYNYVVKAGLKSKAGGVMEADTAYQFSSTGAVGASISPGGGNVGLNTPIKVTFDQPVDHASAQARFSISPAAAGAFSWSGNTMIYAPTGLAYQSEYAVRVTAGVVPNWGLPNTAILSGSLATLPETIKLGVPAYKTQYKMSCELAATRMLLAFRGINVSDWDVLMKLSYNPRPRDLATNSWDDPNVMYVGDVNGNANSTSYGVHAGPIAAAARSFGRSATSQFNVSAAFIATRIHEGNPVIFWGHSTPAKPDSWNTSSGVVQTILSSHARVVYGVVGSADAPIGFHIIETSKGTTMYWTTAELMANMNIIPGVSNQTVVVY